MSKTLYHSEANELCFKCVNAAGGCNWSNRLQPVPGWKTKPGRYAGWTKIIECPEFVEGDRLWSKRKIQKLRNAQKS